MHINDFEKIAEDGVVQGEVVDSYEESAEEPTTFKDAIELLKRCTVMLDFVSDYTMCPRLSIRERNAMARLSSEVSEFTEEVEKEEDDWENDL